MFGIGGLHMANHRRYCHIGNIVGQSHSYLHGQEIELRRFYKRITGQCCPQCEEPLDARLITRVLGDDDAPPKTVSCPQCGVCVKAKGSRPRQFLVLFLAYFVPAALLAAIWTDWAGVVWTLLLVPFMPAIVGLEVKST